MAIVSSFNRPAPKTGATIQATPRTSIFNFAQARDSSEKAFAAKDNLTEAISAATAAPAATSTDLNDLLSESLQEQKTKLQVRAAREVLAKNLTSKEDMAALNATVRAWEAKREWHTRADVAMFSRLQCQCCDQLYTQFRGYFHRQTHRSSNVERWVPSERPLPTSPHPKEVKYQDGFMELCEDCAQEAGYDVASHYDYEGEGEEE